jgi:hypothetical protein
LSVSIYNNTLILYTLLFNISRLSLSHH